MATGMTLEEVRNQFDFPRLESFNKYTRQWPPLHVMVASYFGLGKPEKSASESEIAQFLQTIPQAPK